jgi:hypothetical protein
MGHRIERREPQPPSAVGRNCQAGIQDRPVQFDGLGSRQTKDVLTNGGNGAARGKDRQLPKGLASIDRGLQAGDAAAAETPPCLRIVAVMPTVWHLEVLRNRNGLLENN